MKNIIKWILAVGVSGILTQPIQWLLDLVPWGSFMSKENWTWFIKPQFSILSMIIFFILIIGLSYTLRIIFKINKDIILKKKETELKKINTFKDEEKGIKITWDVSVKSLYNDNPFAYNIQIFCTKHGNIPIRMINGRCTSSDCPNADKKYDEYYIQNNIESVLIDAKNRIYNQ